MPYKRTRRAMKSIWRSRRSRTERAEGKRMYRQFDLFGLTLTAGWESPTTPKAMERLHSNLFALMRIFHYLPQRPLRPLDLRRRYRSGFLEGDSMLTQAGVYRLRFLVRRLTDRRLRFRLTSCWDEKQKAGGSKAGASDRGFKGVVVRYLPSFIGSSSYQIPSDNSSCTGIPVFESGISTGLRRSPKQRGAHR